MAVAYGDCGTYGELDRVLDRRGIARLQAENCYELIARDEVRDALEEEPGTYFLTDFLARTFEHTVMKELGLDRHPELRDDYFGNYTARHLARAAADARHEAGRGARGGRARPSARGARGRQRGPRARAGIAGRRRLGSTGGLAL